MTDRKFQRHSVQEWLQSATKWRSLDHLERLITWGESIRLTCAPDEQRKIDAELTRLRIAFKENSNVG